MRPADRTLNILDHAMSRVTAPLAVRRGGGPRGGVDGGRRGRRWARRVLLAALALLALVAVASGVLLAVTPSVADAETRAHRLAAAHGVEDTGAAVPARFAAALVATEDSRFYSHHGVDIVGVARAAVGAVQSEDSGGSTLDQQLAKLLYFDGQHDPTDQVQEVALAVKIDASYSKPEILEMYAQTAYFGQGAYGLGAASCGYFGIPAAGLDWGQAALLAGLVQAPSAYDPDQHPGLARSRQAHVLDRLTVTGALTPDQAAAAASAPWRLLAPGQRPAPGC